MIVTCPIHGDFITKPNRFIMGAKCGCPHCYKESICTVSLDIFLDRCKVHHPEYDYSEAIYINQLTKVKVTCPKHGEFYITPKSLMKGQGCTKCGRETTANKRSYTLEEFIERAQQVHGNKYDYSKVLYSNCNNKVCIICHAKNEDGVEHGEFWQAPVKHINSEEGCPKCSKGGLSKGETKVENFLQQNNIAFIKLYKIPYDKNQTGFTRIDFYLPDFNLFIEYNGQLHYVSKEHFGGILKFEQQLLRDNYVRNYCISNKIKLLEIKYNENVENVLNNFFKK